MSKENLTERSQLLIKLLIQGRGFEIETEGPLSIIFDNIDSIAELVNIIQEKIHFEETVEIEEMPTSEEIAVTPTADIPVIEVTHSTMENIRRLFSTPWGVTPRTLAEVAKALEVNAVPDSPSSISTCLRRLVRRGVLRRIKKEGRWAYFKVPSRE